MDEFWVLLVSGDKKNGVKLAWWLDPNINPQSLCNEDARHTRCSVALRLRKGIVHWMCNSSIILHLELKFISVPQHADFYTNQIGKHFIIISITVGLKWVVKHQFGNPALNSDENDLIMIFNTLWMQEENSSTSYIIWLCVDKITIARLERRLSLCMSSCLTWYMCQK